MKVNIKTSDFQKEYDIQQELSIDEENLNQELAEQPGKYAFFAALFALAEKDYHFAELELSQIESMIDAEIRSKAVEDKEKLTEGKILNKIHSDPRWVAAELKIIEHGRMRGMIRGLKEGFAQRKDCLVSIASNKRTERDADMRFKRQEEK